MNAIQCPVYPLVALLAAVCLGLAGAGCDDSAPVTADDGATRGDSPGDAADADPGCTRGETRACPPGCDTTAMQTCRTDGTWDLSACGDVRTFYVDGDGDNFGSDTNTRLACSPQIGLVETAGDCDDDNRLRAPDLVDACGDGFDADCSGVDEPCLQRGSRKISDRSAAILEGDAGWGLGWSLACGDVTGDPLAEIVAGAFGDAQHGSAIVVSVGDVPFETPATPIAMRTLGARVVGPDFGAYAGVAVGVASGLRGVGTTDLLMAAPCAFNSDNVCSGGFGFVHGVGAETLAVAQPNSSIELESGDVRTLAVRGSTFADGAGHALAVGDLDGDTVPELVIGAPFADVNGVDSGRVYVVPGPLTARDFSLADPSVVVFEGAAGNARLGRAVLIADLDGDAINDLVIGAPATGELDVAGHVSVIFGPVRQPADGLAVQLPEGASVAIETQQPGDFFGQALAVVSNTTAAVARRRLVVGAPSANVAPNPQVPLRANAGAAWFFELDRTQAARTTDDADLVLQGSQTDELLGFSLASAARFNGTLDPVTGVARGDGIDDLLVGAPGFKSQTVEGAVHIVNGSPLDWDGSRTVTSVDPANNATLYGEGDGDKLGWAVAACDVDGDGFDDAIGAAPLTTEADPGAVYIVPGGEVQ